MPHYVVFLALPRRMGRKRCSSELDSDRSSYFREDGLMAPPHRVPHGTVARVTTGVTNEHSIMESSVPDAGEDAEDGGSAADKDVPLKSSANERERARMRLLSRAFCRLKTTLPWVPPDTKLSKLDTLR